MLSLTEGTRAQLGDELEANLASYRYKIFVDSLGWKLSCERGVEWDQFDRPNTVYVVARDQSGVVCGCARLLPTIDSYLLSEVFPHLVDDAALPRSAYVWELSRFSTQIAPPTLILSRDQARSRFCALFAAVVTAASTRGAQRLITFTALGVERILRSIGMNIHRIGPPKLVDGNPVIVLWIELDEKTHSSLGLVTPRTSIQ